MLGACRCDRVEEPRTGQHLHLVTPSHQVSGDDQHRHDVAVRRGGGDQESRHVDLPLPSPGPGRTASQCLWPQALGGLVGDGDPEHRMIGRNAA